MPVTQKTLLTFPDGNTLHEYMLKNDAGLELKALNYGCTITSLLVPDKEGHGVDVVLGFDDAEAYFHSPHYIGCVVGRYANRIAHGIFGIDGKTYQLTRNHQGHHLHGGINGLDKKFWKAALIENSKGCGVDFSCISYDGEEGYPGNLALTVSYFLDHEGTVTFGYSATTDRKTIINLTQHSYFNLSGTNNILNHELKLNADYFLPVDHSLIPTGEIQPVSGTGFDFTEMHCIGEHLKKNDAQIKLANGFDHNMVLNKNGGALTYAASLFDPGSGILMEVSTTEPGMQLYTGNFLEGIGKNGIEFGPYSGVCLETQHFPDSPNHPHFPSVILEPSERYRSTTVLKFTNSQS